jgi:cbb3-type cytochrome oxidase maturation protein
MSGPDLSILPQMIPTILVFATLGGLSGSALLAFWWAAQRGEFDRPGDAALEILDADDGEVPERSD